MASSSVLLGAFLIGAVCGLRSMVAPAVVAWAAHLGWQHLQGAIGLFFNSHITLLVFSLFALGELIADKLPFIPARTQLGPLGIRIIFGAVCGSALCVAAAASPATGAILGAAGALAGAFAGYNYRLRLAKLAPGLLLALIEDLVAVGGGLLIVSRL